MNTLIKKALATTITTAASLSFAAPAFAQANVNPCAATGGGSANSFKPLCLLNANSIGPFVSNLIVAVFVIAALIALFFLIWGGIKWILSGGDKGKVEAARSTIIAALIGLVVTFLSFFILQLILGLFGIDLLSLQLPKLTV